MEKNEIEVLDALKTWGIAFEYKEHSPLFSMDDYAEIEKEMGVVVPKNLFLNNQQHTKFYLLIMPGEKRFKTKELSKQIHSARLSFASDEILANDLHCFKGSTSVLGLLFDEQNKVQLLIDEDLLKEKYLGFHPCMNTLTVKIQTIDLLHKFLPMVHHEPIVVKLNGNNEEETAC